MKRILIILLLTITQTAFCQGIFDGFQVLKIPRGIMPIGAEWINDVGVNGPGVPESNITVNPSLSSLDMASSFKQDVDLAILNFFNLDGSYLANSTIRYKNLKIYTVNDISKSNLNTGQLILYEAIKADSIYVKIDKEIDANAKLKIDQKLKNLQLSTGTDLSKGMTISGDKLFLAYRVFEVGKTKTKSKKAKIKDTKDGGGLREVNLMNYQITFNDNNLRKCVNPKVVPIDPSVFADCSERIPIDVIIYNFNQTNINGKPFVKKWDIYNNTSKSLYISQRQNNKLITDFIQIVYIINDSPTMLFFHMDKNSKVTVNRMETPLKIFKNPKAAGW